MARFLPPDPDLDHLKNEAKALHKALRQGDSEACAVMRHVRRFCDASDDQILTAEVPLTEVQFALARDYGFASWPALRTAVLRLRLGEGFSPEAHSDALVLPDPPVWKGGGPDHLVAALAMALSYLEAPADDTTLAGDSGRAFILQADAHHKPFGGDVPNLDIGWWPLDRWGATLRLDFLSRAYGVPLRELPGDDKEYEADPAGSYRRHFGPAVTNSLVAGRPVVAIADEVHLIIGQDGGEPPLLGQSWSPDETKPTRLHQYPWCVIVLDEPGDTEPMDRHQIDVAAVEYAVRLGRDEVDLSHLPHNSSGRRSWDLWVSQVTDEALCGPHFYHMNVLYHLNHHRRAAARYLRAMSSRHRRGPSADLNAAAEAYDAVAEQIKVNHPDEEAFDSGDGRDQLLSLIGACVALEETALEHLAAAAAAMK